MSHDVDCIHMRTVEVSGTEGSGANRIGRCVDLRAETRTAATLDANVSSQRKSTTCMIQLQFSVTQILKYMSNKPWVKCSCQVNNYAIL
jgi:hypothetical protein